MQKQPLNIILDFFYCKAACLCCPNPWILYLLPPKAVSAGIVGSTLVFRHGGPGFESSSRHRNLRSLSWFGYSSTPVESLPLLTPPPAETANILNIKSGILIYLETPQSGYCYSKCIAPLKNMQPQIAECFQYIHQYSLHGKDGNYFSHYYQTRPQWF